MSHLNFSILAFFTNFCPIKSDLSGNTVWPQPSGFSKKSPKCTIFGIFNELLSTQNVNVARFARNVEWDFLGGFQTLWVELILIDQRAKNLCWPSNFSNTYLRKTPVNHTCLRIYTHPLFGDFNLGSIPSFELIGL